ncbi:MAG: ABC transporter ATP-binding protein [Candidatus Obscuribacterales bacterium]|nr:ABC transporter ATP-binding protein [Candidatus Obscuribacterales bacterium]
MTQMTLNAENLSVGWQNKAVAQIKELRLNSGQIVVLAGPNGAGKSTVLKCLARQMHPLSGSIRLGERDIDQLSNKEFAQAVGYVPQTLDQLRHLSVYEWVSLGRNPYQSWWSWSTNDTDKNVIESVLHKTGSWELRHKMMDGLSGGERQRVLIATALAQEPRFLLLDEPTAHLDFRHQLELVQLIRELKDHSLGILLVLHDLNLMSRLADEIVLLKSGVNGPSEIAVCGNVSQALTAAVLRKVYQVEVQIFEDKQNGLTSYLPSRVSPD